MLKLAAKNILKIKSFGYSMAPLLNDKDILYIKKISFKKIKLNDILTVQKNGLHFTHRAIFKSPNSKPPYIITRGDNSLLSDGKILPHQIIGKVIKIKRDSQIFRPEDVYLLQSTIYLEEIIKIKKALEKKKVDYLFLKGLPLYLYLNKSHPSKIYSDCDILINQENFEAIKQILLKNNYKINNSSFSLIHKLFKRKLTKVVFKKHLNNFPVLFDVHVEVNFLMNQIGSLNSLYPQKNIDGLTLEFLRSKRTVTILGRKFPLLSQEHLAIYTALHFFHHNFRIAYRSTFLSKIFRSDLNWKMIGKFILNYKLENFVYPAFLIFKKEIGVAIPNDFLKSIKPKKKVLSYISANILKINLYDNISRIQAGIALFKNIFALSPKPFFLKVLVFFDLSVINMIIWIILRRLKLKLWRI